jgi:SIR2-like domain
MGGTTRTVVMSLEDEWADYGIRQKYLGDQLNDSAICLILGAGISVPFGLPSWDGLLDNLYTGRESIRPKSDLPRQAEYFRTKVCGGRNTEFVEKVGEALYRGKSVDFETLRKNATLGAIGALVMNSVRGRASVVINFNFDDLLERFLEYHGFVVHALSSAASWTNTADVEILHPHGFIPSDPSRQPSDELLFTQDDYSRVVGDDSLPWRQKMLSAMRTRTCLFIGTSGLDGNMDSLIMNLQQTHAAKESSTAYWGVWFAVDPDAATCESWKTREIYTLKLASYEKALPSELFVIAQEAAGLRGRKK